MNPTQHPASPLLGEDFAAGVLEKVDMHRARRRRMRGTVAGLTAGCAVAVAIVMGQVSPSGIGPASRPAGIAVSASSDDQAAGATNQTGALGYMFPDAAPLADFDNTYFMADSASDDILASDTTDADGTE